MGAGQSSNSHSPGLPSQALHVLRVTPSSPASRTDIEPFFDFVVGFDGDGGIAPNTALSPAGLETIVESHEGRVLNLLVWNSKNRDTRTVSITPSRNWVQGDLAEDERPSLLGLSMRMCEPELSLDNVWHVMDVLEGSPAESAGLVPYGDYIVGWSGGVLNAENDFYELVESHVEKPLRVYIYSHDFDTLREVVLVPNRHWGGDGLLGCVFGYGLLHRIPPQSEAGRSAQEDNDEQDEPEQQSYYVPADDQRVHDEQERAFHDLQERQLSSSMLPSHDSLEGREEIKTPSRPGTATGSPVQLQSSPRSSPLLNGQSKTPAGSERS